MPITDRPHARRARLTIGPVSPYPSWTWIGPDTARELGREHDVTIFERFDDVPAADVVFIVKQRPPLRAVARLIGQGARLVYLPVDAFEQEGQLREAAGFLKACSAILCHSERLIAELQPYGRKILLVEHHARLILHDLADRATHSYVLWNGGFQHLPYLLAWLQRHPLPAEVKVLSDVDNEPARVAAARLAHELGVELQLSDRSINGLDLRPWDDRALLSMMGECRAMVDIKGSGFGQATKPPTKAQQAIASGIPFACDSGGGAAEYLRRRGFEAASPLDVERWFSEAYWSETRAFGRRLRDELTIERVVEPYRRVVAKLLAP
jgi:hypothetical protein